MRDRKLNERLAYNGKPPNLAVVIEVERAFFHCSKCMIRSGLWEPDKWPDRHGLPNLAETMVRHGKLNDDVEDVDEIVRRDAVNRLY